MSVSYVVRGIVQQMIIFELAPGESIVGEPGAMLYMENGIEFDAYLGENANHNFLAKSFGAIKRKISGENFFLSYFFNKSNISRKIAFAANIPGRIIDLDLRKIWWGIYM